MINIGVIGYGHWGPNHVRVFNQLAGARVATVADAEPARLENCKRNFPTVKTVTDPALLFADPDLHAVIVATPVVTHYALVKAALLAGKDVFVEKPITHDIAQAEELIDIAAQNQRILMCGHIFLFNPGIRKLKQYIDEQALGQIYYLAATRTNLGPVRPDVSALYDLGSHDVSIFQYLVGRPPREVLGWGKWYLQRGIEDVAFGCLEFSGGILGHFHVSWLNPRKERSLTIVGDRKMAVLDDTSQIEPIRLYDKGVMHKPHYESFGQFHLIIRDADILIPKLPPDEPLKLQNQHFLDCIRTRQKPITDGVFALDVVRSLEALQTSLREGKRCPVQRT